MSAVRPALALLVAVLIAPGVAAGAEQASFDIPAQDLSRALLAYSRQSDVSVSAPASLLRGRRSSAVKGRLSSQDAIDRLLAGSGLRAARKAGGGLVIELAPPASAPEPARQRAVAPPPAAPPAPLEPDAPVAVSGVVVTGFRSGLVKALDIKRETAAAVDTILAEDIGKFPDLNLSESIQRIPGVAITRDAGEGRQIAVRGLGGVFTRVRVNGMETVATSGGANAGGGTNRGRSFDFNVFASELFSRISVQKTASASAEEGSLGATVDLATARPFDKPGFTFAASAKVGYNDLSQTRSPRAAALISNTFLDGRLGVLASVAYTERELLDLGYNAGLWQSGAAAAPGFRSAAAGTTPGLVAVNAAVHPRIPRYDYMHIDQERLGATAALQWRPNDRTELTLDLLHADFRAKRNEAYLETFTFLSGGVCGPAAPASCGLNQVDVVSATVEQTRPGLTALTQGVFNNIDLKSEARYDELETRFDQATLRLDHKVSDAFKISALLGASRSDFANDVQSTIQLDQYNVQGYAYDYRRGVDPVLNYGDADLLNPGAWTLSEIRSDPNWVDNRFATASLQAEWTMTPGWTLKAGASRKRYRVEVTSYNRSNGTATNVNGVLPEALRQVPVLAFTDILAYPDSWPGGGAGRWLIPSIHRSLAALRLNDPAYLPSVTPGSAPPSPFAGLCFTTGCGVYNVGPEPVLGANFGVEEVTDGAFAQLDFRFDLLGAPAFGDVGLRYVTTRQEVSGYGVRSALAEGGAVQAIFRDVDRRRYDDLLPALNLVVEPTPDLLLRFHASKVMSRPELAMLRPGVSISTISYKMVSAGNPDLAPFRARTIDLAAEWYFAPQSLLSLALFHKQISSLVQPSLSPLSVFSANPFGLPDEVGRAACGTSVGCAPELPVWQFNQPINTPGGPLYGAELTYQQPFAFLPVPFDRFGFIGNLTAVRSRIRYLTPDGALIATGDINGLSRRSYNATLYYESKPLSARVSLAYRSRYTTSVPGRAGTNVEGANSALNVDFALQRRISRRLALTLEGLNLTNQPQSLYADTSGLANYRHVTGRQFVIGLRFAY
jgi:iron complex outermembrane receptor protein